MMVEFVCQTCGRFLTGIETRRGEAVTTRCPGCGAEIVIRVGRSAAEGSGEARPPEGRTVGPASDPADEGYATLFRGEMLGSALEPPAAAGEDRAPGGEVADRTVLARPGDFAPPPLAVDRHAFFLVLGADPGRERIRLVRARTVFGRAGADVDLGDPAVSALHCQVDIMGADFFVRDLDSRNGTFLNGRRIRYMELRPGDELRIGRTILVFRTSDDHLAERETG